MTINRAQAILTFPANFMLVAATPALRPAQSAWADLADYDRIETPRWTTRGSVRPATCSGTPHLAEAIQYRPRRGV